MPVHLNEVPFCCWHSNQQGVETLLLCENVPTLALSLTAELKLCGVKAKATSRSSGIEENWSYLQM